MPVWPSCFCTIWPVGAMRHHEVAGADDADVLHRHAGVGQRALHGLRRQVDDVLVGVLPELGHVDPQDPQLFRSGCHRAQPPSGSKPKPTASVPSSSVPMTSVARRTFMPVLTCSGSGVTLIRFAPHARALAVDHRRHEGHRDAGSGERDDGERAHLTGGGDVGRLELGAPARGAGVAPVEEARPAGRALVGHQVRVVPQHQVVHQRDLLGHRSPHELESKRRFSNYRGPRRFGQIALGPCGPAESARRDGSGGTRPPVPERQPRCRKSRAP